MDKKKSTAQIKQYKQDAMLHGREGLISQSFEIYNKNLSKKEKKEKYNKMAASPYSFYRGSNHIFWQDFEWDWRMTVFGNYRTRTWLNGDCHAYNFGAYQSHKTGVIYGLNDFDESVIADYQYDLWRLAISLVLIPDEPISSDGSPFPKVKMNKVLDALSSSYLDTLLSFANNKKAGKTCYTRKNTTNPLKKFLSKTEKKESRQAMLDKWTVMQKGTPRFNRDNPDVEELSDSLYQLIEQSMPDYILTIKGDINFPKDYFKVYDIVARKNAGTGSLGSNRYYVLIKGGKSIRKNNVILDIKETREPSAFPYATQAQQGRYKEQFPNEGIRYTEAYKALDYHPDDHLGWLQLEGKFYGVRERNAYKKSFKTDKNIKKAKDYIAMAKSWGMILATEHARAEKVNYYSLGEEVKKLTKGKIREFKKVVRETARGYARVVNCDYQIFVNSQ